MNHVQKKAVGFGCNFPVVVSNKGTVFINPAQSLQLSVLPIVDFVLALNGCVGT